MTVYNTHFISDFLDNPCHLIEIRGAFLHSNDIREFLQSLEKRYIHINLHYLDIVIKEDSQTCCLGKILIELINAFIISISLHAFQCHRLLMDMCLWHHKTSGRARGTDIRM